MTEKSHTDALAQSSQVTDPRFKVGWNSAVEQITQHLAACGFRYSQGFDIIDNIKRRFAAHPPAAPVETAPTKEDFAKWSRVWHDTCETIMTLLGLRGGGSPAEMLAEVQAHLGARCSAGSASDTEQVFIEICDELGCAYDNESALMEIDNLKRRAAGYVNEPQEAPEPTARDVIAWLEKRQGISWKSTIDDINCALSSIALSLSRPHGGGK